MHITEFEKLNYNYIIQELALKNEIGPLSRRSTLNELNTDEFNINKKIKLQPLINDDTLLYKELKTSEYEFNNNGYDKINKSSQNDFEENNNKYNNNTNNNINNAYIENLNRLDGCPSKKNANNKSDDEKAEVNMFSNSKKSINSHSKIKKKLIIENNNLNMNESDEEPYDIEDVYNQDILCDKTNENEICDNNIFRRGQQKFISSPNYRTKNINRLYHLLNKVTPLYKTDSDLKINSENQDSCDALVINDEIDTLTDNKQKKFKMLRFSDESFSEKLNVDNMNETLSQEINSNIKNYIEISCKLLNSRIRLGKPIPVELEIINKSSNLIPYLKIVVNAIKNEKKDDSFCGDKIMFAYYLEPGKKCIKKFSLEPYLWNNEEDSFYDDVKNLKLNTNMNLGSNTLYSTNNLSNTKSNIITNKNFSSYYYYSKLYTRNKYSKNQEKVLAINNLNKSMNSLTNIFDLGIAADKDGYNEYKENSEVNYNALRVIPKEAKTMLYNLPSSIKVNVYDENSKLLLCNNSEFTLKSEYFTQDFYLLGQYFKLNENETCISKSTKYKKYRKSKNYSINILLVNSSIEAKNKFIHSLEYALFVEKQLLSKNSVREFRDLLIDNYIKFDYYNDTNSKFYWNNNKENYQEIKMANHFPKNIKFYDCPCNDGISNTLKENNSIENCSPSKRNKVFSNMNTLIKNKLNGLTSISSNNTESNINFLNKKTEIMNSSEDAFKDNYCCWLDGDEAELISKGELPLGKKILGEKIYYSDIEEDFYNESFKKNPIHNIIYLFSYSQIENMDYNYKKNINQNINKLLKMKKK
ncbi:hypothetical protein BCR36DRAFT_329952, partial [Piromyces finnis]